MHSRDFCVQFRSVLSEHGNIENYGLIGMFWLSVVDLLAKEPLQQEKRIQFICMCLQNITECLTFENVQALKHSI